MFEGFSKWFRDATAFCKDAVWWLGILVGGGATVVFFFETEAKLASLTLLTLLAFVGACIKTNNYRVHVKRQRDGLSYVHKLMHSLRDRCDNFGKPETAGAVEDDANSNGTGIPFDEANQLLTIVLDNAAHCFRELTGRHCTSSLIMPGSSERDGQYLKSVLYCSDVDPERRDGVKPQKGGLTLKAFDADTPLLFEDYEEELKKGNYVKFRPDGFKWAKSGFMAHFKVRGIRFGILNVDSPMKQTFRRDQAELLCAFADCCGLIITLSDLRK